MPIDSSDTLLRVNRKLLGGYPRICEVMHLALEAVGPEEYDVRTLKRWMPEKERATGPLIYEYLQETGLLSVCVGLRDLEEICARGLPFYRMHFGKDSLFGWKSIIRLFNEDVMIPCLYEDRGLKMGWYKLTDGPLRVEPVFHF